MFWLTSSVFMAGDERPSKQPEDIEAGLRRRLRVTAVLIVLGLVVFLVVLSPFLHVSELIVGSLLGTLLLLLGIEAKGWFPIGGGK